MAGMRTGLSRNVYEESERGWQRAGIEKAYRKKGMGWQADECARVSFFILVTLNLFLFFSFMISIHG